MAELTRAEFFKSILASLAGLGSLVGDRRPRAAAPVKLEPPEGARPRA